MATKTETMTQPSRFITRDIGLVCDLCGKESKPYQDDWREGQYDVNETTIEHRTGSHYPDNWSITTVSVDLCPTCFQTKLIPWLEAQGCQISRREDEN